MTLREVVLFMLHRLGRVHTGKFTQKKVNTGEEFTLGRVHTGERSHWGEFTQGRVHTGESSHREELTRESSHWGEFAQGRVHSAWGLHTAEQGNHRVQGQNLGYKCDKQNYQKMAEQEKLHIWPLRPILVAPSRSKYPKIDGLEN